MHHSDRGSQYVSIKYIERLAEAGIEPSVGSVGDEVLRGVARILLSCGRVEHLCARYGGEEFVVLMPEADHDSAVAVAERIRHSVMGHRFEGGETQPEGAVTVSLGIATFPADGPDGEALIGRADAALYFAKEKGRNRVIAVQAMRTTRAGRASGDARRPSRGPRPPGRRNRTESG